MACYRTGDKPLSESMLTRFTDAYMRHYGEEELSLGISRLATLLRHLSNFRVISHYYTQISEILQDLDIEGLVQHCSNSIANALELLQSCTKPSLWWLVLLDIKIAHDSFISVDKKSRFQHLKKESSMEYAEDVSSGSLQICFISYRYWDIIRNVLTFACSH